MFTSGGDAAVTCFPSGGISISSTETSGTPHVSSPLFFILTWFIANGITGLHFSCSWQPGIAQLTFWTPLLIVCFSTLCSCGQAAPHLPQRFEKGRKSSVLSSRCVGDCAEFILQMWQNCTQNFRLTQGKASWESEGWGNSPTAGKWQKFLQISPQISVLDKLKGKRANFRVF